MTIKYKPKMTNTKFNKQVSKSGTINVNPASVPSSGKINLTPHPPSIPPFHGWIAPQQEEMPESEIPPTMKSGQIELNGFEGCICAKCNEFYPYAEPNMDDGTLVCYSCRNPWPN